MIYQYQSDDGKTLEITQPINAPALPTVECAGTVYRRVFSALAIVYKTSGFYTTDNSGSIDKWRRENLAKD